MNYQLKALNELREILGLSEDVDAAITMVSAKARIRRLNVEIETLKGTAGDVVNASLVLSVLSWMEQGAADETKPDQWRLACRSHAALLRPAIISTDD